MNTQLTATSFLFDKDMRWTRIYECVKADISVSSEDFKYYEQQIALIDQAIATATQQAVDEISKDLEIRQVDPANFFTSVPILYSKKLGKDVDNNHQLRQALS